MSLGNNFKEDKMDNLLLDAETLFLTADIVDNYCAKQREIINVYYQMNV